MGVVLGVVPVRAGAGSRRELRPGRGGALYCKTKPVPVAGSVRG